MIIFSLFYAATVLFSVSGHPGAAALGLGLAALYVYADQWRRSGNPVQLKGLFFLGFYGGEAVACLQMSRLSRTWTFSSWAAFFAAGLCFWLGYDLMAAYAKKRSAAGSAGPGKKWKRWRWLCPAVSPGTAALALALLSFGCFLTEAAVLGYVPILVRGMPDAYARFHLPGLHYVTVLAVLVPALCIRRLPERRAAAACVVAVLIPILCVSRSQLMQQFILAAVVLLKEQKYLARLRRRFPRVVLLIGLSGGILAALLGVLSAARGHDSAYLRTIFEMKDPRLPAFVSRMYIYLANNYDNFDLLVSSLEKHAMGMKGLYPLWTFTGLKHFFPALVNWPLYVDKEELTTVTVLYDAWYDFGLPGVMLLTGAMGAASALLTVRAKSADGTLLLYAQMAFYLLFSFFTTWFSLPVTWFYFGVSALLLLVTEKAGRGEQND